VGIRRHRLYQEILARITQLVQSGEVQVGSVFPREKDLAERYGVSVSIIREAFRVLEHTGLVQGKQGGRRYLVSSAPSFGSLLHGMELVVQRDLMEARRAVEVSIVRLAAARCQPEDIERLREMVEQEPNYTNNEAFRVEDMRFHQAVADVTHNSVLSRLQQYINDLRAARQAYTMSDETRKALRVHHLPLVMALAAKDPDQAERAMVAHLEIAREAFDSSPEFRAGQR
jgi:DNA-binding FadR family transcriptional regulator